jgi:hypothetical protein
MIGLLVGMQTGRTGNIAFRRSLAVGTDAEA